MTKFKLSEATVIGHELPIVYKIPLGEGVN